MTEQQALDELCDLWEDINHHCTDYDTLYTEEREQAFTLAESALERQIPRKPNFEMNLGDYTSRFICPCGKKIIVKHDSGVMDNHDAPNYCSDCGQALDWSN